MKPLAGLLTQQQLAWIEKHLEGHAAECQELATFLCGISRAGFEYPEEHYGCLAVLQPVRCRSSCTPCSRSDEETAFIDPAAVNAQERKLGKLRRRLLQGLTAEKVAEAVTAAQLPTAQRVQHLEEENRCGPTPSLPSQRPRPQQPASLP